VQLFRDDEIRGGSIGRFDGLPREPDGLVVADGDGQRDTAMPHLAGAGGAAVFRCAGPEAIDVTRSGPFSGARGAGES